jgi:hypothetical protein
MVPLFVSDLEGISVSPQARGHAGLHHIGQLGGVPVRQADAAVGVGSTDCRWARGSVNSHMNPR